MSNKSKKIQFEFPAITIEAIEELQNLSCATSMAEVVRNAIFLYSWLAGRITEGDIVMLITKDGKQTEAVLPTIFPGKAGKD